MAELSIKDKIKEILEKSNTIPFLFVGTGLSKRYIDIVSWKELLIKFSSLALNDEFAFDRYENKAKQSVGNEKNKLLPYIATLIEYDFNEMWYTSDNYETSRKKYKDIVKSGVSPFKLEISNFFKKEIYKLDQLDNKCLLNELKLLKKIGENNINGIITTNYDTLLEKLFPEYHVFVGQQELIFSPLQGVGEIYKIHGCCNKPCSIIINKEDYDTFSSKNAYLSAKLLTIFLEHPIVFIGYSLNDDNINDILMSITNCLSQEQLNKLKDRLIFVERNKTTNQDKISSYTKEFNNGKRIDMTKLFIKDYSQLYIALLENKTKSRYSMSVLRKLKKDIYDLILTNDPEEKLRVVTPMSANNDEKAEYVIGVGISNKFGIKGLIGIKPEDVFRDIIFDDLASYPDFDNDIFVIDVLPQLLKFYSNSIPIYKYIYNFNKSIDSLPEKIRVNIKNSYESFLNSNIKKNRINSSINKIRKKYGDLEALKHVARISEEYINTEELYDFIKDLYAQYPSILSEKNKESSQKTDLRRIIKIYDWLTYYDKIKERELL